MIRMMFGLRSAACSMFSGATNAAVMSLRVGFMVRFLLYVDPAVRVAGKARVALPRVFWTGSWEVAPDAGVTGPLLRAAAGDRAVLPEPPPGLPPPGPPEGPVAAEGIRVDGPSLQATVVAPRDGLVVILDPFYPGWTATVDGKPAPILRADFAFQAVPVPAGTHELRLTYRNRWVSMGAAVSLGTLALLVGALWMRSRRLRRAPATATAA